ncbi:MAG: MMPL family transporter [Oligoflexia bacterium]|nr:MMPL family transporter [Oligoflexia bacterium]
MVDLILKNRVLVFIILILLTCLSLLGISKIKYDFFRVFPLPSSDPAIQANNILGNRFGGMETVTILVESDNILSSQSVQTVRDLSEEAKTLSGVKGAEAVVSIATVPDIISENGNISFSPLLDQLLKNPSTVNEKNQKIVNVLLNSKKTATLIIVYLGERAYPDSSIGDEAFLKKHNQEINKLIKKYSKDKIKISATGSLLILYLTSESIKNEIFVISGIAILLLMGVYFISFKSTMLVFINVVCILVATLWTFGIMGFLKIPLSVPSIYIIIIILAVGSSYTIHVISTFLVRYEQIKISKIETFRVAFFDISMPLLTVSFAAALSGLSLITFEIVDIRELGIMQSLGIFIAYFLAYFIMPAFVILYYKPKKNLLTNVTSLTPLTSLTSSGFRVKVDQYINNYIKILTFIPVHWPLTSLMFTLIIIAVSLVGVSKITANFVIEEIAPKNSMPSECFEKIKKNFGTFRLVQVLLVKNDSDSDSLLTPKSLEIISQIDSDLNSIPGVKTISSIADVMNRLKTALVGTSENSSSILTSKWKQEEIDQILLVVGKNNLSKMIDDSNQHTLITLSLDQSQPANNKHIISNIQNYLKKLPSDYKAYLSGSPILVNSLNEYIVNNKIESIIICLVIALTLCVIVNSSLLYGLISVSAAAISAIAIFGVMGFKNINLDMGSATITTIAIGVGIDYAIHFIQQFRNDLLSQIKDQKEYDNPNIYPLVLGLTTKRYGKTIFFDSLANIIGFSPLLFSNFPILKTAGFLLVTNEVMVVFATFFITSLLITILKTKYLSFLKRRLLKDGK